MLMELMTWASFLASGDSTAAGQRRRALQEHFSGGAANSGDGMMALLWMVAVLALAVLVLVVFERHRRAKRRPNPKKLGADLLAAEGLGESQQELVAKIAAAGRIEPPTLLLFSEAILRSATETYIRRAPDAPAGDRRRAACEALAEKLYGAATAASTSSSVKT